MSKAIVKWLTLFLLACLIPVYSLTACSPQQAAETTSSPTIKTLTVGASPWPGFSAHYVAMAKDFYKAEGVDVKEVYFSVGSDANTALLARKLDAVMTGIPDLVIMAARDPSLRLIMLSDYSNGSDGILGRNITKPEDLKGKKVARENLFLEVLLLQKYLEKGGLTEKDVVIIDTPAANAAAAFVAKQVDVAVTYEPWLTKAAKEGKGELIFSSKGTNIIPDGLVTTKKVIQDHKPELLAYMRAIDKAVKLINEKPEETTEIIAKKLGISPKEVPQQVNGVRLFDIKGNQAVVFNPNESMNVADSLIFAAKTAKERNLTPNLVDAKTLCDDSLIKSL